MRSSSQASTGFSPSVTRALVVLLLVAAACLASGDSGELEAVQQENAELKLKLQQQAAEIEQHAAEIEQQAADIKEMAHALKHKDEETKIKPKDEVIKPPEAHEERAGRKLLGRRKTGKCDPSCKTCSTKDSWDFCKTCNGNGFVAVARYKVDGQGNPIKGSQTGRCLDPTKQRDLPKTVGAGPENPYGGMACLWSKCKDGSNGRTLGMKGNDGIIAYASDAKQVACSRVCMVGGHMNVIQNLERTDGKKLATKYRSSPGVALYPNGIISSPVCMFHKVVLCTKKANFDAKKCKEGDQTRCEDCRVQKTLKCYAVVPYVGFKAKDLKDPYNGFKHICNYVKDPCAAAARYL